MPRMIAGQGLLLLCLTQQIVATDLFSSPQDSLLGGISSAQNVFAEEKQSVWSCADKPQGPIDATLCDYETVEDVNEDLVGSLNHLIRVPFFKYMQLDLYRGCPFWQDDATCSESTCTIETIDESAIPEEWRTKVLSRVKPTVPHNYHQLAGCYYRDSDFCLLEDPQLGEFYDLSVIPERYTGYTGAGPRQIWGAIYEDNCFSPRRAGSTLQRTVETCIEEKVYNKVISGLHASISTHICLDHLNQTTGEWGPNLQCYLARVASHPERLEYIYFNTVLLLRAISRLTPYLGQYDYYLGLTEVEIEETKRNLDNVITIAQQTGKFDESQMFSGEDAIALREDFKAHFRNISRIMDCIDCDQCRLWGKVQTTGVATAMKILFELDDTIFSFGQKTSVDTLIQRSELAALFNTLNRFSESLQAASQFREIWLQANPTSSPESDLDAGENESRSDQGSEAKTNLFQYCKDSAADCVDGVARLWTKGLKSLEQFMMSNEDDSPSRTEL